MTKLAGTIQLLPEDLINQIAAGEVVERPASIVKELVENSLDAGADSITIQLEDGGKQSIRITDNGSGMVPADVTQAITRHATSKLHSAEELARIATLGFRGEALASISSVSDLIIKSRPHDADTGYQITVANSQITSQGSTGMQPGTIIQVDRLFHTIPARQKFLKATPTELRHCLEIIHQEIVTQDNIQWKVTHNNQTKLSIDKNQTKQQRIQSILNIDSPELLIPIYYDHLHLQISGFIGKPQTAQSRGISQYAVINGRTITDPLIISAVRQAVGNLIMPKLRLPFVIYLNLPPEMVDVNVHPRKAEVRFVNSSTIFKAILQSVSTAIQKQDMTYQYAGDQTISSSAELTQPRTTVIPESRWSKTESGYPGSRPKQSMTSTIAQPRGSYNTYPYSRHPELDSGSRQSSIPSTQTHQPLPWETTSDFDTTDILQIHNTYLLYQTDAGLKLVDQHAADERIRFEQLTTDFLQKKTNPPVGGPNTQPLLIPVQLKLSQDQILTLEEYSAALQSTGITYSLQKSTLDVTSIPAIMSDKNITIWLTEIINDLEASRHPERNEERHERNEVEGSQPNKQQRSASRHPELDSGSLSDSPVSSSIHLTNAIDGIDTQTLKILTYLSCRGAVKAGDYLTMEARRTLLTKLEACTRPYTCPHGRPVTIELTKHELEKMFKRII